MRRHCGRQALSASTGTTEENARNGWKVKRSCTPLCLVNMASDKWGRVLMCLTRAGWFHDTDQFLILSTQCAGTSSSCQQFKGPPPVSSRVARHEHDMNTSRDLDQHPDGEEEPPRLPSFQEPLTTYKALTPMQVPSNTPA